MQTSSKNQSDSVQLDLSDVAIKVFLSGSGGCYRTVRVTSGVMTCADLLEVSLEKFGLMHNMMSCQEQQVQQQHIQTQAQQCASQAEDFELHVKSSDSEQGQVIDQLKMVTKVKAELDVNKKVFLCKKAVTSKPKKARKYYRTSCTVISGTQVASTTTTGRKSYSNKQVAEAFSKAWSLTKDQELISRMRYGNTSKLIETPPGPSSQADKTTSSTCMSTMHCSDKRIHDEQQCTGNSTVGHSFDLSQSTTQHRPSSLRDSGYSESSEYEVMTVKPEGELTDGRVACCKKSISMGAIPEVHVTSPTQISQNLTSTSLMDVEMGDSLSVKSLTNLDIIAIAESATVSPQSQSSIDSAQDSPINSPVGPASNAADKHMETSNAMLSQPPMPPIVPKRTSAFLSNCRVSDEYLLKEGRKMRELLNIVPREEKKTLKYSLQSALNKFSLTFFGKAPGIDDLGTLPRKRKDKQKAGATIRVESSMGLTHEPAWYRSGKEAKHRQQMENNSSLATRKHLCSSMPNLCSPDVDAESLSDTVLEKTGPCPTAVVSSPSCPSTKPVFNRAASWDIDDGSLPAPVSHQPVALLHAQQQQHTTAGDPSQDHCRHLEDELHSCDIICGDCEREAGRDHHITAAVSGHCTLAETEKPNESNRNMASDASEWYEIESQKVTGRSHKLKRSKPVKVKRRSWSHTTRNSLLIDVESSSSGSESHTSLY